MMLQGGASCAFSPAANDAMVRSPEVSCVISSRSLRAPYEMRDLGETGARAYADSDEASALNADKRRMHGRAVRQQHCHARAWRHTTR